MQFFVVYAKSRKKFDKFIKVNKIRNKYIIDLKKIIEEEGIDPNDKIYLKIIILNKINQAIEKNKDVYYLPNFDVDFSIEKLLNIRKMLFEHDFNILLFYNEFRKDTILLDEALNNLSNFTNSQIIRDY